MAFSMHSHSGQFCPGHAKDELEEVVQTAIAKGMKSFALTEHMPLLTLQDLYPDTVASPTILNDMMTNHDAYIAEAIRLKEKYSPQIRLIIGFEGEFIRPDYSHLMTTLASNPHVEFFIGSVHHVHEVGIDYSAELYNKAKSLAGGTDERLYEDYFDLQYAMLRSLNPKVVGHFDLIRLLAPQPNKQIREMGEGVWAKAVRNMSFMSERGLLMEVNTAALRKGLEEPYPSRTVCEEFIRQGGRFTLSDDSHGMDHIGTNYERGFAYLESLGVTNLWILEQEVSLEAVRRSFKPDGKIQAQA